MIKKFLTVLVLGLAVFAVSCSKDAVEIAAADIDIANFIDTTDGILFGDAADGDDATGLGAVSASKTAAQAVLAGTISVTNGVIDTPAAGKNPAVTKGVAGTNGDGTGADNNATDATGTHGTTAQLKAAIEAVITAPENTTVTVDVSAVTASGGSTPVESTVALATSNEVTITITVKASGSNTFASDVEALTDYNSTDKSLVYEIVADVS